MKTKNLILFFLAFLVISLSMSAHAFNDGHLDGVWFKTRIYTLINKNHSISSIEPSNGPQGLNGIPIIFDSGRNNCYSVLFWGGDITFFYYLHSFCKGSGSWEFVGSVILNELVPVNPGSVGNIVTGSFFKLEGLVLPAAGKSINSHNKKNASYVGPLVLKPSVDKYGIIRNVKLVDPNVGVIFYSAFEPFDDPNDPDDLAGTYTRGAGRSGLTMDQVKRKLVPKVVKDCLTRAGSLPGTSCTP